MDMPARTDRSGAARPPVSGLRLPGRLRIRRALVVPPAPSSARG
jgi:hypothetical protein